MAAVDIDRPFHKACRPLNAKGFLRRLSYHILCYVSRQVRLPFLRSGVTDSVITDGPVGNHIHDGGNLYDSSRTDTMSKVLPDIDGVRMLSTGPTSPLVKPQVRILGTLQPRMGAEDAAPMLAKAGTDRDWFADHALFQNASGTQGCFQ